MPASGFIGGYCLAAANEGPSGFLGGYCLSKVPNGNQTFALLGGYLKGQEAPLSGPAFLGGYCLAIPLVLASGRIGGYTDSKNAREAFLGGYCFGAPDNPESVSARARTLVLANSDLAVGQKLEFDATIVLKQAGQAGFNALLWNVNSADAGFTAEVEVEKFKRPPSVFILSMTKVVGSGEPLPSGQPVPNFDPNGARKVCVVASGVLGDGEQWVSAQIDFGDPFDKLGGFKRLLSVSGFSGPPPWSVCHDYDISGLYYVVARGQDDQGMVGMDASGLNLASGAQAGIHYPAISISGQPRSGEVPPSFSVAFTTTSSGLASPPYTAAESEASKVRSPTDSRIMWSFGNRERSVRKDPVTFYQSPGLFAPRLAFLFSNPSGIGQFIVSDTLLIGFNR